MSQPKASPTVHTASGTVLTDIQRAARFYYLQKVAFGAKVAGQTFGTSAVSPPRLNLLRIEEDLSAAHLRLARCTIENLDWQEVIKRYDRPATLFYLDPPYWETAGYDVDFDWAQYEQMANWLRTIQGKAILSINDHPDIRAVFDGLPYEQIPIRYTVASGTQGKAAARHELLIRTWG